MDKSQLESDIQAAEEVIRGDVSGNRQFDTHTGNSTAVLASLIESVASWVSAPSGPNDAALADKLRVVANAALGLKPATNSDDGA